MNVSSIGNYSPRVYSSAGRQAASKSRTELMTLSDVDAIPATDSGWTKFKYREEDLSDLGIWGGYEQHFFDTTNFTLRFFRDRNCDEKDPIVHVVVIDSKFENGYKTSVHTNQVNPSNATYYEMMAVKANDPDNKLGASRPYACLYVNKATAKRNPQDMFEKMNFTARTKLQSDLEYGSGNLELGQVYLDIYRNYEELVRRYLLNECEESASEYGGLGNVNGSDTVR